MKRTIKELQEKIIKGYYEDMSTVAYYQIVEEDQEVATKWRYSSLALRDCLSWLLNTSDMEKVDKILESSIHYKEYEDYRTELYHRKWRTINHDNETI